MSRDKKADATAFKNWLKQGQQRKPVVRGKKVKGKVKVQVKTGKGRR